MRSWWWACVLVGALTCFATYQLLNQPSLLDRPTGIDPVSRVDGLPGVAEAVRPSLNQEIDQRLPDKDQARLPEEPADSAIEQLPKVQEQASQEDAPSAVSIEPSAPRSSRRNLSYLAFYFYSELPPETKPAVTVLDSLKDVPLGTPVEEIKRVTELLGLDFTFMKTVARIESGFNPNQRTGSYIGLFQLSRYEFDKYGSGDIRGPRDNTVAAALKFTAEAILFEMFTHKKPTLNDRYLIHQQGIEGAAEHISHPSRLAWRSMCATEEGKEKGEKWCKRAIWGNTLPAFKRVWKNVNNVTSSAFVGMWQQRVSQFYSQYSVAAGN